MKTVLRPITLALLFFLVSLVSGCVSTPTVQESKVVNPTMEKVKYLQLVFRDVAMTSESSSLATHPDELVVFGGLLVSDAQDICAKRNINVLSARVDDGVARKMFVKAQPDGKVPPMLVITPSSGRIYTRTTSRRSSFDSSTVKKANYIFSVQLFDIQTRSELWEAKIDTSAWNGPSSTVGYDDAYISQFMNAILDQMAKDGLI